MTEYIKFRHVPSLDGLRAVAVLMVMIYHLDFILPGYHHVIKGLFTGVDVFFVLSGFLITSILVKEYEETGNINLKNFFLRRTFRLVPALWFFLICLAMFGSYLLPTDEATTTLDKYNFLFAAGYLMNWYAVIFEGFTGNLNHTWSLAIEEQFYILWSIILFKLFAENKSRKQIFNVTLAITFVLIIWRAVRVSAGTDSRILYYSTESRIDALLIGCLAAFIYAWQIIPKVFFKSRIFSLISVAALIVAGVIIFSFSHQDVELYYLPLSLFSSAIGIFILWLVARQSSFIHSVLELKVLRWIGQISYGLYLWHFLMFEFTRKTFEDVFIKILIGFILAFIAATLSFYLIEKPFLNLKNKF